MTDRTDAEDGHGAGTLSDAVVVFLQRFPLSNADDFTARFPAPAVRERVQALLDEALRIPEPTTPLPLPQIAALVRSTMAARHPDLSDDALRRLGNYVAYQMR